LVRKGEHQRLVGVTGGDRRLLVWTLKTGKKKSSMTPKKKVQGVEEKILRPRPGGEQGVVGKKKKEKVANIMWIPQKKKKKNQVLGGL